MFDLAVAITAHRRPLYLQHVLRTWHRALRDCRETPVFFQIEPVSLEVIRMCRDVQLPVRDQRWIVNNEVLGPLRNPHEALSTAFDNTKAKFVVLGEDDSIVSPDLIDFFDKMAYQFQDDKTVLAVCSFNRQQCGDSTTFHRSKWFASVVWGTWRDRWEEWISPNWGFDYGDPAWDQKFVNRLTSSDQVCIAPCTSRSQHIGEHEGAHMDASRFEELQADSFYLGEPNGYFLEATHE